VIERLSEADAALAVGDPSWNLPQSANAQVK
jgi:hypothetical protein